MACADITPIEPVIEPVIEQAVISQPTGVLFESEDLNSLGVESEYSDAEEDLINFSPMQTTKRSERGSSLAKRRRRHTSGDDDDLLPSKVETLLADTCKVAEQAEEFVKKVWEAGWRVVHHGSLPKWLRDNEFLHTGHRPPTNSFGKCFKSIFRIHTETVNIWTHLLGMVAFVCTAGHFFSFPSEEVQWQEKVAFSAFFVGAILCLTFSWVYHTVYCHSESVHKLFNKLDYCGIALLTMGSFVPWLHYSFYCRLGPKITYLTLISLLSFACIVVSLWDKFAKPQFRAVRAGVFIAVGLSGAIPALHYVITDGFYHAVNFASLGWLILMAVLYIVGALIYAARIPERFFPGKFDIWSHQIFHVFVVAAAFVHYHGITKMATYRLTLGDCLESEIQ